MFSRSLIDTSGVIRMMIVSDIITWSITPGNFGGVIYNETAHYKNVNNHVHIKIYSYLETSGSQSSNLYLNIVYFFNTSVY
jgi:hypothetical protein